MYRILLHSQLINAHVPHTVSKEIMLPSMVTNDSIFSYYQQMKTFMHVTIALACYISYLNIHLTTISKANTIVVFDTNNRTEKITEGDHLTFPLVTSFFIDAV